MSGSVIEPSPRAGAVYDVGDAYAVYWPDVHPCGPLRPESWIVFTPDGLTWWKNSIRPDARYLGMMPGPAATHVGTHVIAGHLFEEPQPLQHIQPGSWLNDPRHNAFAEAYGFALTHLTALAAKAFEDVTPEQVYLVWKTVQTAFAGIERHSVIERFPR